MITQEFWEIAMELIPLSPGESGERSDAAANRALVLETAAALFAQRGVAGVNMSEIAQAAGVGKGTLYRRFANKGELCLALMDSHLTEFQDGMLARMRAMTTAGIGKIEQLAQFMEALVYFTEDHVPLLCEVQRAGLEAAAAGPLELPHFWQHMTVSGLLQAAAREGEIAGSLDIEYLADALLAPLNAQLYRFQRRERGFSPERISAALRSLVLALPQTGDIDDE